QPGVETHRGPGACGSREQQIVQIVGEYADRLFFRALPQLREQLALELPGELHLPRPASRLQQPSIAWSAPAGDVEARGNFALAGVERLGRCGRRLAGFLELLGEL